MSHWQPTADVKTLRERAAFFASIRAFFAAKEVYEVDTPILSTSTITDIHIDALNTALSDSFTVNQDVLYLQTSPEYFMKRLLAAGSGDIYYLGKSFRNEGTGPLHHPEFTMLEWYRCGFDMHTLIDEVIELVAKLLSIEVIKISYQNAFLSVLNIDPLQIDDAQMSHLIGKYQLDDYLNNYTDNPQLLNQKKNALLDWLFSHFIEAELSKDRGLIVTDFPASQASLAKLSEDQQTANRFELYIKGVEIANGFAELTDAAIQESRFVAENMTRRLLKMKEKPIDTKLIAALDSGMPECAGVALGVDRLFMLHQGKATIAEVTPFGHF